MLPPHISRRTAKLTSARKSPARDSKLNPGRRQESRLARDYDRMIVSNLRVSRIEFEQGSGWTIKPEGACRGDVCVPLRGADTDEKFDLRSVANALGMALVEDPAHGVWAVGPATGGRALSSAALPPITLPEWRGGSFSLGSLRGTKVLLLAWASW